MAVKQICFTAIFFFGGVFLLDLGIETVILLDTYEKLLTDTQAKILRMRFDEDLSLGEIGELLEISRQAARDAIIKGEQKLVFLEETLKVVQREREIRRIASQLEEDGLQTYADMLKKVTEEI